MTQLLLALEVTHAADQAGLQPLRARPDDDAFELKCLERSRGDTRDDEDILRMVRYFQTSVLPWCYPRKLIEGRGLTAKLLVN